MKTSVNFFLWVVLVVLIIFRQSSATAAETKQMGMTAVVNNATITGTPMAVFDLITTARLWPQWHPATKEVGGVVERPYGLGDFIHERGKIGDKDFKVTWKVVEHVRPSKIVLQSQNGPARITYTFKPGKGTTRFTRKLEYQVDNFASVKELEKIMRDQSERGVSQLKALVERFSTKRPSH
jgi:uncharacterized protein YndB with AHSA1/START domain